MANSLFSGMYVCVATPEVRKVDLEDLDKMLLLLRLQRTRAAIAHLHNGLLGIAFPQEDQVASDCQPAYAKLCQKADDGRGVTAVAPSLNTVSF